MDAGAERQTLDDLAASLKREAAKHARDEKVWGTRARVSAWISLALAVVSAIIWIPRIFG